MSTDATLHDESSCLFSIIPFLSTLHVQSLPGRIFDSNAPRSLRFHQVVVFSRWLAPREVKLVCRPKLTNFPHSSENVIVLTRPPPYANLKFLWLPPRNRWRTWGLIARVSLLPCAHRFFHWKPFPPPSPHLFTLSFLPSLGPFFRLSCWTDGDNLEHTPF